MSSHLFVCEPDHRFMPADPDILLQYPIDHLSSSPADYSLLLPSSPSSYSQQLESLSHAVSSVFKDETACGLTCQGQDATAQGDAFSSLHSYDGHEGGTSNAVNYMQRSYSCNSFQDKPGAAWFQPRFDMVMESATDQFQGLPGAVVSYPESGCMLGAHMRRVFSAGDLQRSMMSNLGMDGGCGDELSLRIGRYSAEQRKERILKYRAKRTQRNFTKTIKYACRKTLADNRPRIRGRFARNDEVGELPDAPCSSKDDDEEDHDHLWLLGMPFEEEEVRGRQFIGNGYGYNRFPYSSSYGYHC